MGDTQLPSTDCYKRHAEIQAHIEEGKGWRTAIISIIIAIFVQVGAFLVMWGSVTKMVEINTKRLDRVEDLVYNHKNDVRK